MYNGRPRSTNKRHNADNKNHPNKSPKVPEVLEIGEINVDSWRNCFQYLDDENLATMAYVCNTFKVLAEELFHKRHKGELKITLCLDGWKPKVCRFKNVISRLYLLGIPAPYSDRALDFCAQFLIQSLEEITIGMLRMNELKKISFPCKFLKLEALSFVCVHLNEIETLSNLIMSCPNLKSLTLSACTLINTKIFEQFIPKLEDVTLFELFDDVSNEKLVNFFTSHSQLKRIAVDLPHRISYGSLTLANEKLTNLEKIKWRCDDFDLLPNFQQQFVNLKELTFLMDISGTCQNQLLRIAKDLPQIELLQVVNCKENTMTNVDLVEMITACATLKTFGIYSTSLKRKFQFTYDFHRKICRATSNRSTIDILLYFQCPYPTKRFVITKKWIKEDGRLIILAPEDLSNY